MGPSGGTSSPLHGESSTELRNNSRPESIHGQKQLGKGILEQVAPLMRYYVEAFKSGSYPSVTRDEVFLWVQAHPRKGNCSGSKQDPGPRGREWVRLMPAPSVSPAFSQINILQIQDRVSAYALLSSPGNATLACGPSSNTTAAVPCGLSKLGLALPGLQCCKADAALVHDSKISTMLEQQGEVDMAWVRRWVPLAADWETDEDLAVLVPVPVA